MTDMFDALMFVPTAALIITHDRPWRVVSRLLLSWGLASIIRITTVAITSVPDPRPSCEYAHGNVFSTFTLHRCGDAIYSGHTLIFVVCSLVWSSFAPRNWLGRILTAFVYGLAIAGSLIVIANRAHYTIDVLLAWYIAPGAWYIVAWFWFWHVTKKGRLLKIEFPVEVGRHRDSDSEEKCQRRRVELGLMPDGTPYDPVALYLRALHGEPELSPPVSAARTTEKQEVDGAAPTASGTPNPNDECVLTIGESSSQAFTEDFSARH
ncbi:hypothetical protein GGI03_007070 [Coemansia sp. RSA 2337]|nr:hypothetical protein GGI03_007070 [Coemansia sp. RSA 2337]